MAEKGQGIASGALNAVIQPVADIAVCGEDPLEFRYDAVVCALEEGPDRAMNLFNTKKEKKKNVNTNSPAEGVGELQSNS